MMWLAHKMRSRRLAHSGLEVDRQNVADGQPGIARPSSTLRRNGSKSAFAIVLLHGDIIGPRSCGNSDPALTTTIYGGSNGSAYHTCP